MEVCLTELYRTYALREGYRRAKAEDADLLEALSLLVSVADELWLSDECNEEHGGALQNALDQARDAIKVNQRQRGNAMSAMLTYPSWHTPATDYPRRQVGSFRIASHRYAKGFYRMSGLRDSAMFEAVRPLTITNLQERRNGKWETWMVDDPPHWEAMKFYASKAHGAVLTTGLGLGLVLHALKDNPGVESVTVVERSADVIALMNGHVPSYTVVHDDFYLFLDSTAQTFDTCIIDLWVANSVETKMRALSEAAQTYVAVQQRWPTAHLFFHGFPTLCHEVWPMSSETLRALDILARAVA